MKKNKLTLMMVIAFMAYLFLSCDKPKNNIPVADTETESAVDAIWTTFVVTDIEQQCAFASELSDLKNFYIDVPGSKNLSNNSGTMTSTNDPSVKRINVGFNNTLCYDGRNRDGTVYMYYDYNPYYDHYVTQKNPDAKYLHDYGFVGKISFAAYHVDGWEVKLNEAKHGYTVALVANMMPANYVASAAPIKWRIIGDFIFKHPTDASKNMEISVDLIKSLLNSNDKLIYNQSAIGANIHWSDFEPISSTSTITPRLASDAALIAYTGTITGTTSNGNKFRMVINENQPLMRDFTCYADKIGGISKINNGKDIQPVYNEFHPFSRGVASFTTGCSNTPDINVPGISDTYPRQVYFANEDNPGLDMQCDNSGTILIKGIGYKIDFRK